jgi:hypothetical protein
MKPCSSCKQHLPSDRFSPDKSKSTGLASICKECRNKRYSTRYSKQYRDAALKKKYNMEPGDYDVMLESQGGVCKICHSTETGRGDQWFVVDHCHKTNKIRGLLCNTCNRALGLFKDDISYLEQAIHYLKNV